MRSPHATVLVTTSLITLRNRIPTTIRKPFVLAIFSPPLPLTILMPLQSYRLSPLLDALRPHLHDIFQ